jgi:hypothetical protein
MLEKIGQILGKIWQARQDKTRPEIGRSTQDKTRQDQNRQDKTRQDLKCRLVCTSEWSEA